MPDIRAKADVVIWRVTPQSIAPEAASKAGFSAKTNGERRIGGGFVVAILRLQRSECRANEAVDAKLPGRAETGAGFD